MTGTRVMKSEFARMVGRTPQAVTKWIKTGKLTAPALVGEGAAQRIDVELALAQLRLTLDPGQQLAQAAPLPAASPGMLPPPATDDAGRLAKARADREELELQIARAKAAALEGYWMVTAEAREAWTAEAARFVQAVESWLVTAAAAEIMALPNRDARSIAAALRSGFRQLCDRIADRAAAPPAEDDPVDDDDADEPVEAAA